MTNYTINHLTTKKRQLFDLRIRLLALTKSYQQTCTMIGLRKKKKKNQDKEMTLGFQTSSLPSVASGKLCLCLHKKFEY